MCAHKPCTCGQTRPTSVAALDALDDFDGLDDIDDFAAADDVADWAVDDGMEDALGFQDDTGDSVDEYANQYTFGADDRFQVRSQPNPPSTRFFPFNTVCQIRQTGTLDAFSGVLITSRVVLTVKHGLFTNLGTFVCDGPLPSTRTTRSLGRFIVQPGLDQTQPAGRRTIVRPMFQVVPPARQVPHPGLDLALMFLPRPFRVPERFRRRTSQSQMLLQARSDDQTRGRLVTLAGYPADMPFGTMWAHSDHIQSVTATHLRYRIDLCPGQSGGPVWLRGGPDTRATRGTADRDIRILLGIQSGQRARGPARPGQTNCGSGTTSQPQLNCGVRMTCDTIRWILAECRRRRVPAPHVDQPTFRRCPRPGR
jgi:hypothetical protein